MRHAPLKWIRILLPATILLAAGCAGLALRASPSLLENMSRAFFEECDPQLARQAMPAQLKLLEGLLQETPGYPRVLTALSVGFTGYAMLFVEESDPGRASLLYARGAEYGFKAIGLRVDPATASVPARPDLSDTLENLPAKGAEALLWGTTAWYGWLALNRDKPAALGQLPGASGCLQRLLALRPELFGGTPLLLAAIEEASKPAMLGSDPAHAKTLFEQAIAVTGGRFFLVPYHYARDYAVRVQDRVLFHRLLESVLAEPPDTMPEFCLINSVVRERAKALLEKEDELFF